jgi:hypothetical protein
MTNGEKIQTILDVDRDCTEVHGDNGTMTFTVTSDFWSAEYKEPSNSGKPNKLIEEKCPCYYCEHFEIKGLSHCKIHEDTYGDSRCNDYHKINQKPNKSEIPTGSTTKNDLGVDCISRKQAIRELKESAEHHANDSREEALLRRDRDIIKALPPATPQEPRWIPISERLPKIADVYRVTRYYPNNVMNHEYLVDACFFDGSNTWYNDNRINHERDYANNVIAWQENPEPYKAESEE